MVIRFRRLICRRIRRATRFLVRKLVRHIPAEAGNAKEGGMEKVIRSVLLALALTLSACAGQQSAPATVAVGAPKAACEDSYAQITAKVKAQIPDATIKEYTGDDAQA